MVVGGGVCMKSIRLFVISCMMYFGFFACAQQSPSFDTLFPVFWYEKSIQSTMRAIHEIDSLEHGSSSDKQRELSFIVAIGHLSFAHFCIMHMNIGGQPINEDITYFSSLLNRFNDFLISIVHISQMRDQVECLINTVRIMQKQLQIKANV